MPTEVPIDFRALFEAGSVPYALLDTDLAIVMVNDAYVRVSARPRDQLIGRCIFDAFPEDPQDAAASGMRNLRASLERVLRTGVEDRMPMQKCSVRRPPSLGGAFEARFWQPVNSPLPGAGKAVQYIVHHVEDVTHTVREVTAALHDAQKRLQHQVAELTAVIESAPEAIYIGDADGITRCNRHALEQLGFDSLAELQQHVPRLSEIIQNRDPVTGEALQPHELQFVRALQGERAVRDTQVVHLKTGERRLIRGAAAPICVDGKVIGAIAINTDVTEERARERKLRDAHRRVEEMLSSVNAERDFRERTIASLAHDLRTPLSVAKVSAEIVKLKADDVSVVRRAAARIAENIERADRMLRELLDTTRTGEDERLQACDLVQLASRVIDDLALVHGDRFVLQSGASIDGRWNRSGIQRVLENLCSNAAKYGAPGAPVTVRLDAPGHYATIEVHNEGEPIPEADLASLFVPYWRVGSAQSGGPRGWGIGLTLVRGIVEAHGGTVSVESAASRGTTFRVVLPLDSRSGPA